MSSKKIASLLCFLVAAISVFSVSLNSVLERKASSFVVSESGSYLIENVPVRGLLVPFDDLAYLRITDKRDSNTVFRSPLYSRSTVDMSSHEDDVIVGIVWIDFYKRDQHFGIRVPDWKTHWLNSFISNTPYEIVGGD
ncbi:MULTISPECIES: hypothetical protein [Gammaproteobacteria]|uniref:hypothetical protein n=1 Tax=Gammaproteobacteria TaxID=1236 RepID=UPI001913C0C7|nr:MULTISPECIES: hypothetical protein [Gammaproteobacteria]MBK5302637.1 hypothetical protein [Bacillus sp. TH86]MBK5322406.1 hypothetical protein [Bacillus sp. TH59]MBK5337356.1 hypothetical protein [Bacillus sp. TH57]MBK5311414.1 hypothetical protein [Pseudomonas sp. TH71]MBK5316903.1 hypothetical protein [Erwinia sp. TH79]